MEIWPSTILGRQEKNEKEAKSDDESGIRTHAYF